MIISQIILHLDYCFVTCRSSNFLGKLQISLLKFGVDWILHPKVSEN